MRFQTHFLVGLARLVIKSIIRNREKRDHKVTAEHFSPIVNGVQPCTKHGAFHLSEGVMYSEPCIQNKTSVGARAPKVFLT